MRQVCIIGGSFNPIHMGHLQIARSAQAHCMADEVWFLPAGQPWQKQSTGLAPADVRKKLVELAIEGVHSWRVEPIEIEQKGPSYTVNTLESLSDLHPDCKFTFVMGADQLDNLTSWKHWESLFDFARIGVVDRIQWGEFKVPPALNTHLQHDRLFRIPMPSINISATQVRRHFELLSASNPEVVETASHALENSLPSAVFRYLSTHAVYGRLQP